MSIVTTSAILLRSHPYGETSRILRFLTREHGILGVMARGVRKEGSRRGSSLETFSDGALIVHVRETRELQTYRDFSVRRARPGLGKDLLRLSGAALLAEIVLIHTAEDANPGLFHRLIEALDAIEREEGANVPARILSGAWRTVAELGYAPSLDRCVECRGGFGSDEVARFDLGAGGLRCSRCGEGRRLPRIGPIARRQLGEFVQGAVPADARGAPTHLRLLGGFVEFHLAGSRPLRTLPMLSAYFGSDDA